MNAIPFRQRLVVRLAVGMIGVALLSLFLTFCLQYISMRASQIEPPGLNILIERALAENPDDLQIQAIKDFPIQLRNIVLRTTLISIVISGGLWILLAILFARSIAQPIERVTQASNKITQGDLTARVKIPFHARGETVQLLEHFNEMASSLETYERERTEMIASIAHELRTPLAVMNARLELMQEGMVDLDNAEVARLSHQTNMLTRLVNDLRTLSLADANRLSLDKREVNLKDLVQRVLDAFKQRTNQKNIGLKSELSDVRGFVDPVRLEQVVINLLDNACKHTPEGGEISIFLNQVDAQIHLSIQDTGTGFEVPPETLFQRFYTSADEETSGTGLGLALVQALVHLHEGDVLAKNHQEGGAVFEVRFPQHIAL